MPSATHARHGAAHCPPPQIGKPQYRVGDSPACKSVGSVGMVEVAIAGAARASRGMSTGYLDGRTPIRKVDRLVPVHSPNRGADVATEDRCGSQEGFRLLLPHRLKHRNRDGAVLFKDPGSFMDGRSPSGHCSKEAHVAKPRVMPPRLGDEGLPMRSGHPHRSRRRQHMVHDLPRGL